VTRVHCCPRRDVKLGGVTRVLGVGGRAGAEAIKCAPLHFWDARSLKVKCYAVECLNKLATKIANVCCDGLLLAHPSDFVVLIFVSISHQIFLWG